MNTNEETSVTQQMQELKARIKSKKNILECLKASRYYLIKKTIEQKEKELSNLQSQYDSLFRMYQRGHK